MDSAAGGSVVHCGRQTQMYLCYIVISSHGRDEASTACSVMAQPPSSQALSLYQQQVDSEETWHKAGTGEMLKPSKIGYSSFQLVSS